MKIKRFDDSNIIIVWDNDRIYISDLYNSFNVCFDGRMVKYFIYCTEILCKISKTMGYNHITFHRGIINNLPFECVEQRILNQLRENGYISGNYMEIDRKDLILSCFKKCFKMKQEKLKLKDIDLQDMPITALIYIRKGLL